MHIRMNADSTIRPGIDALPKPPEPELVQDPNISLRLAEQKGQYMQLEIGQIYEGRVKSITQYGAFVEVSGGDGERPVTGMVHISEVANSFVRDIHEFLQEEDVVRVKVIAVNPQGKISMSVKQAADPETEKAGKEPPRKRREPQKPRVYEPKRSIPQSEMSFEDKLLHFKQASEEKICDLKRGSERRGGSRSRRS